METRSRSPRSRPPRVRTHLAAVGAVLSALTFAAACVPADGGTPAALTFWTPHTTPDRIAQQEATARAFTEKSGIPVEVVPMSAAEQNAAIDDGPKADDAPDVVLIGADQAAAWAGRDLLDTTVPAAVVDELDPETFDPAALALVSREDTPVAVPSDAWVQVLIYRKDLFELADLPAPTTWPGVAAAARRISTDGVAGIALGTAPGDPFTARTLEAVLMGNGCALTDENGGITLGSPQCERGLRLYERMASAAPKGPQDADSARRAYLAGESAMVLWGSHLLDEAAGLVPDSPPVCEECQDDARFLAENSGVATVLTGPGNRSGAPFGGTLNLGVPRWADTKAARAFIDFLLTDGYLDSLETAPEGRVPLRTGPEAGSTEFADAWTGLSSGEGGQERPLSNLYDEPTLRAIAEGARSGRRWGDGTARSALAAELGMRATLTEDIGILLDSRDAADYATRMVRDAEELRAAIR